jgi:hypothetical protein
MGRGHPGGQTSKRVPAGSTPPPSADGRPPRAGEGGPAGGAGAEPDPLPGEFVVTESSPGAGGAGEPTTLRSPGLPSTSVGVGGLQPPALGLAVEEPPEEPAGAGPARGGTVGAGGGELVHEGLLGGREADAHHEGGALVFGLAGAGHEGSLAPSMAVVQHMFHVKHLRQTTTPPTGQERDPSRAPFRRPSCSPLKWRIWLIFARHEPESSSPKHPGKLMYGAITTYRPQKHRKTRGCSEQDGRQTRFWVDIPATIVVIIVSIE